MFESDAAYRARVERENAVLVGAAYPPAGKTVDPRAALAEWADRYLERRAELSARDDGEVLVATDLLYTYTEGVARYVENRFTVEPAVHPPRAIPADPRFARFAAQSNRGRDGMFNRRLGSAYYYELGANLSALFGPRGRRLEAAGTRRVRLAHRRCARAREGSCAFAVTEAVVRRRCFAGSAAFRRSTARSPRTAALGSGMRLASVEARNPTSTSNPELSHEKSVTKLERAAGRPAELVPTCSR